LHFRERKENHVHEIWIWGLVLGAYLAPSLLAGFALAPAGEVMSRWGRSTTDT